MLAEIHFSQPIPNPIEFVSPPSSISDLISNPFPALCPLNRPSSPTGTRFFLDNSNVAMDADIEYSNNECDKVGIDKEIGGDETIEEPTIGMQFSSVKEVHAYDMTCRAKLY